MEKNMLTLEKLNALRGIISNARKPAEQQTEKTSQPEHSIASSVKSATAASIQTQSVQQSSQVENPVEIPCKNYPDETGHFAYIDAKTQQISHVNLENGNIYKLDDVYRLSLQHSVEALSSEYHKLTWQQVLSDATVYDRFGSPMFSFSEIQNAYEKFILSNAGQIDNKPKTDAFGLPL